MFTTLPLPLVETWEKVECETNERTVFSFAHPILFRTYTFFISWHWVTNIRTRLRHGAFLVKAPTFSDSTACDHHKPRTQKSTHTKVNSQKSQLISVSSCMLFIATPKPLCYKIFAIQTNQLQIKQCYTLLFRINQHPALKSGALHPEMHVKEEIHVNPGKP